MRILTFLLALTAAAQTWKPAAVTLKTTWGEKVTPANAWREYPRPQFVRDRWENLNGLWDYAITPFRQAGSNEVLVGVAEPSDTGEQPRGKQVLKPQGIWYTAVSGIWQTVWMEPVPSQFYISELRLTPDVDAGGLHVAALVNEP